MKFFAILRDSLREALDAKVIYFLFGLSVLAILLVASISFKAEPGEKGLESIIQRMPGARGGFGPKPINYAIDKFEQTNNTPYAYKGEYRYDLVVTESVPGEGQREPGEGEIPKQKKRPEQDASAFKSLVILIPLVTTKVDDLTEEQRAIREELGEMMIEVARAGAGHRKTR